LSGVVGKPDDDGDPAVHYAALAFADGTKHLPAITIERVEYDHGLWADQLAREGVPDIFVGPPRTGFWTCGRARLPRMEREMRDGLRQRRLVSI
jgi:hypothetical protein